jgi:hypothetical protein
MPNTVIRCVPFRPCPRWPTEQDSTGNRQFPDNISRELFGQLIRVITGIEALRNVEDAEAAAGVVFVVLCSSNIAKTRPMAESCILYSAGTLFYSSPPSIDSCMRRLAGCALGSYRVQSGRISVRHVTFSLYYFNHLQLY